MLLQTIRISIILRLYTRYLFLKKGINQATFNSFFVELARFSTWALGVHGNEKIKILFNNNNNLYRLWQHQSQNKPMSYLHQLRCSHARLKKSWDLHTCEHILVKQKTWYDHILIAQRLSWNEIHNWDSAFMNFTTPSTKIVSVYTDKKEKRKR